LPFHDGDIEAAGAPDGVAELRATVRSADLLVMVTPAVLDEAAPALSA